MHLLFLLPFLKLCCFTNQVKQRGKRRGEAVSKGTDLTQIFETHAQDPPPCIKKKKSSRSFFSRREERERDEWEKECRRQTGALSRRVGMLERPLFLPHKIQQGVHVNTQEEGREECEKSHLRETPRALYHLHRFSYLS